jgi:HlyD family secretion protein
VVGRVRAFSRAGLGASISGTVASVNVQEGDRVGRGDLLLSLDDREAAAQVRQAEAALSEVTSAAARELEEAERDALQSERELARLRAVFEEGGLTRQRVEQAEQRAADAASRLVDARAGAGENGQGEAAVVARARAALDAARARLTLFRVTAPAEGVILSRDVEPGDAVSSGQVVLGISFDGPSELVVFPSEENLSRLSVGAPASASADAYPTESFAARVSFIAPAVDPSQGTIEVRLIIGDPPSYLLPDMTVSVNIETGRREGAVVVLEDAVQGLGTSQPWVGIVQDGRLVRRDVQVGLRASEYMEIASGVDVGDVVLRGASADDLGRRIRVDGSGGD